MWQHRWAVWGGILGATASCLAKIAVSNDSASPLQWVYEHWCEPNVTVDLDDVVSTWIYKVVGDLMIRHRINLMPYVQHLRISWIQATALQLHIFEVDWCQFLMLGPRLVCFIAMLVMNAYMLAAFLKGMQLSGSVVGTAITTACNFATSALWGALVWNERFVSMWWLGFSCVLAGVLLLSSTQQPPEETSKSAARSLSHTLSYRGSNKSLPNSVSRKYGEAFSKYESPTRKSKNIIDTTPYGGGRPSISSSEALLKITANLTDSPKKNVTSSPKPTKVVIQPNKSRIQQQRKSITALTDRSFFNECPLCDDPLFDKITGESSLAIADLSPSCHHILHARCLKFQQKQISPRDNKSKCPICDKTIPMFVNAKQAAHFGGFWIERVEKCLKQSGPLRTKNAQGQAVLSPQPASVVREWLSKNDTTLTMTQKRYIEDDPTGLGKGLMSALEWGGSVDFNDVQKGRKGWHICLRTKGIWEYSTKQDDIWLWEWGQIHPRQRCDQCQLVKASLPVACRDCQGSAEAAYYCCEACQKRDKQRHKMTCQLWQRQGPQSK
jgi:multidrug transporter EmrE-like cation transporter